MKPMRRRFLTPLILLLAALAGVWSAPAAAPAPPARGGFTIAVLPDTQMYAWKDPSLYAAQTKWIAVHVRAHKIEMVLHLGDITQHNTNEQWRAARSAHDLIARKVPCAIAPGNHDLGPSGRANTRDTAFTKFFPLAGFQRWPAFGGVYDKEPARTENNFHRFTAGGRKWLVLALEFGPRDDVVRWANDVVKRHADHSAILITHAYLRPDHTRYDRRVKITIKGKEGNKGLDNFGLSKSPDGFNDGEDLWQKLVSQHANFVLVVSGHTCVTGRRTDNGRHGNPVHQMVVDYQNQERGGNGFLRLLQFQPDGKTVRAVDYSPVLDALSAIPETDYQFELPPAPHAR
jgi:Calcineurin-like phosphoesterase